jgi:hypothetical protein
MWLRDAPQPDGKRGGVVDAKAIGMAKQCRSPENHSGRQGKDNGCAVHSASPMRSACGKTLGGDRLAHLIAAL